LACQEEFFVNNPLDIKENDEHALDFGLGEFGLFHLEDCCFISVITVNPSLVTSDNPGQEGCFIGADMTKLLADIDMLLLLISCRNSGHKFDSDMVHA
jgi:hypothetical protein